MTDPNMSYEAAFKELREIEADIQNEAVSVDVLAEKVKRASELIALCQSKLQKTEFEVNKIISQMEQKPTNGPNN
ncbi:exodeoxyribonuclease VII small subunit [uncultured Mucilaginibacter sp.]|uniref:exodeoxyribonuclease VII small subunit n=1 Tax=uncultured Mucilaginibacter sp. TaxID=797541 RepID=UPI0025FA27AE|nr:exodeoxyribonuclease VII small subunit [uncultured Mucilaginibacter sp.]